MASGLSSPLGITSLVLLIIGFFMIVAGIGFLIYKSNQPKPWYVWTLLGVGIVFMLIGGVLFAIAMSRKPVTTQCIDSNGNVTTLVDGVPQTSSCGTTLCTTNTVTRTNVANTGTVVSGVATVPVATTVASTTAL